MAMTSSFENVRSAVDTMEPKLSTGWPQKSKPQSFVHIFVKYWPILKICSLVHSAENL